jgi:chromosome partitioning protein
VFPAETHTIIDDNLPKLCLLFPQETKTPGQAIRVKSKAAFRPMNTPGTPTPARKTTMLKISITARKGGQARSTSAFHLAGAFARLGFRVLIIDADGQPTVSKCFLTAETVDCLPPHRTIAALYDDRAQPSISDIVHPTTFPGISIIPGSDHAAQFDHPVPEDHPFLCDALRDFLPELDEVADILIMDTAPSSALLTYSTLVAADFAITPVVCEVNAVQELQFVKRFIEKVAASRNANLRWLGIFPSQFARRLAVHRTFRDALDAAFTSLLIPVPVPESALVKEAAIVRKPLPLWKPRTLVGKAYTDLAEEILRRAGVETPAQRRAA